jgi:predicted N-acetyltransferase YhbS
MAAEYTLCDHVEVPNLPEQLARLSNLAFGDYEGAMPVSERWVDWFLRRPGTDPHISQAALDGRKLIANVLVCAQELQLGGDLLRCGIIDSVATDPDYRRQGLARVLMERTHEKMQRAGLDAAVLYTNPDDHPYRFYERLGYVTRARAALLSGPRPEAKGCAARPVDAAAEAEGLRALLNDYFAAWEGYAPLDDDLWAWHKLDPATGPPTVVAEMTGSEPVATVTFADADVLMKGKRQTVAVAYDMAARVVNVEQVRSLLSAAPHPAISMILDEAAPERAMVEAVGLKPQVAEVVMVLPFSARARRTLQAHHGPWYAMVESIIGV